MHTIIQELQKELTGCTDDTRRLELLNSLADHYRMTEECTLCRLTAEQALALADKTGNQAGTATALGLLAGCDIHTLHYDSAIEKNNRALAIARGIQNAHETGMALYRLSIIYYNQMNYDTSLEYLLKSKNAFKDSDNQDDMALVLNMLGVLDSAMNNIIGARKHFMDALHLVQESGNEYMHSLILNNIADRYYAEKQFSEARMYYEQARAIAESNMTKGSIAFSLTGLGEIELQAGNLARAAEYVDRSLSIARDIQQFSIIHSALYLSALVAIERKDTDTACDFLLESIAHAHEAGNLSCELDSERLLVSVYKSKEKYQEALAHNEAVDNLTAQVSKNAQQKITAELQLQYDTGKRERELELYRLKNVELASARLEAEKANLAKSDFLTTMSHELRTPMNGVIGAVELLLNTHLAEEQQEFAHIISSSAQSLMDIIRDIMDISKIEKGTIELEQVPFDLEEIIEQTFRQVTVSALRKQLELILDYPLSLPHHFTGDPSRLKEILVNLVSNSVKFTAKGYVLLRVEYSAAEHTAGNLKLTVIDSGRGVPLDLQPVIFDIFTQADYDGSFGNSGSGLGLSITHQLVEAMHGTITLSSVPGNGATFSVSLPISPCHSEIDIPAALKGIRVLAADSHSVSRQTVNDGCRSAGMQCTAASSLHEVLEKLAQGKYDFAILNRNITDACSPAAVKHITESLTYANRGLLILCKISSTSRDELCSNAVCVSQPVSIRKICSIIQTIVDSPDAPLVRAIGSEDLYGDILKLSAGKRCLLVEDNVINQKVTTAILRKLGYEVDVAENGLRAIDMIDRYSYNVILMDCQMPIMDGYRATKELRIRNVTTPIIGVTANAMEDDRDKCLKVGMDDYLPKPVKIASMKALLQHWDS